MPSLLLPPPAYATAALAGVPQLLVADQGFPKPLPEWAGQPLPLAALHPLLGCQSLDVVLVTKELIFIIDAEDKFREPCLRNLLATALWYEHVPTARGRDYIAGTTLLCRSEQFS